MKVKPGSRLGEHEFIGARVNGWCVRRAPVARYAGRDAVRDLSLGWKAADQKRSG